MAGSLGHRPYRREGAMHARSTTVEGDPQAMDDVIAYVRDKVAPLVGDMDGYVGISMICDRERTRPALCIRYSCTESLPSPSH